MNSNKECTWWIDFAAIYIICHERIWFTTYEIYESEIIEAGSNILLPAITISTVELLNGLVLIGVRYISIFGINLIAFMDLRPHKPIFDWEFMECILHIGNRTERIAEYKRLWSMRFPIPHRKAATPSIALTIQENLNASSAQKASERSTDTIIPIPNHLLRAVVVESRIRREIKIGRFTRLPYGNDINA
jgi:hypothetical protein